MADAVTSQTIVDTDKRAIIKLTNLSDGSGESSVQKVDVSGLNANAKGETCSNEHVLPLLDICSNGY